MYRLIKDGTVLAIKEALSHCKLQKNGTIILAEDGDGIIHDDVIYNLPGHEYLNIEEVSDFREIINEQVDTAAVSIAFAKLAESGQIDEVTASEHGAIFLHWEPSVGYRTGQYARYDGKLYRCLQAHTSQDDWNPKDAVSLWKLTGDITSEWPEWSQPIAANDAYAKGDKVSHNEKHWTSITDANVWEPGVYGWNEAGSDI